MQKKACGVYTLKYKRKNPMPLYAVSQFNKKKVDLL